MAPGSRRRQRAGAPVFLWVIVVAVMVLLYAPILVVAVYSFNGADSLVQLNGWSLQWYGQVFQDEQIRSSFAQSLQIAAISSVVSTVLGTAMAIGLRHATPWLRRLGGGSVLIRLISPETATAVALFLLLGLVQIPLSFVTVLIGHVALSLAFVVVIVRSRLVAIGPDIEDAAMDLGATPAKAVWLAVVPLLAPSILVSALLSFILSFGNFVTSFFLTGIGTTPLPLWIYSSLRFGVSPVVNALGMIMLALMIVVALVAALLLRWNSRRRS